MRRFLILLAGLLFLSACGATDTAAIRLGDQSISEQELAALAELVQGPAAIELGGIDSGLVANVAVLRQIGSIWLQNAAERQALEDRDIVLTDQARLETEAFLSQSFPPELLTEMNGGEAYEALITNAWLQGVIANLNGADAEVLGLMSSADISSSLGTFDEETRLIVEAG